MTDYAIAHFSRKLQVETDVSDVADALAGTPGFVLVDVRSTESWQQGRIPGAIHLPGREITERAADLLPSGTPVVVYCWGPGCNGATRGALAFAELGYPVKEMIGGYEYWVREGFETVTDAGPSRRPADDLTTVDAVSCAC